MSLTLLIALAASIPLAALGWVAGWISERPGGGPRLRSLIWATALVLPATLAPAALLVEGANLHSPLAVVRPLMSQPQALAPAPTFVEASSRASGSVVSHGATAVGPKMSFPDLALIALIAGAGAWVALLWRMRLLARLVARSSPCSEGRLPHLLAEQALRLGVAAPALRIDPDGGAPLLVGVLRPTILLPAGLLDTLSPERIALICAHELAHLKRRDNLKVIAESVLVALFWFNPILRANQARLAGAREEICDAMALAAAEKSVRRAYADSLFSALSLAARPAPALAFTGQHGDMVRRRLRAILRPAGAPLTSVPVAVGLGAGLLACGAVASVALAASPPVRAATAAAVGKAVAGVSGPFETPDPQPIQIAQLGAATAHPSRVRFEIRVISGPERMYADILGAPRGEGFAFVLDPTLHSTYDDGPTLKFGSADDFDRVLGQSNPNELRWWKVEDASTSLGKAVVLSPVRLSAQTPFLYTPPRTTPTSPETARTFAIAAAEASLNQILVTGPGFVVGAGSSANAGSASQFTLALSPFLRPNGRIRLEVTATSSGLIRPIPMKIVDDGLYDTADPTAKPSGSQPGQYMGVRVGTTVEWHKFHQEGIGEPGPTYQRTRTSTIELSDHQVLAIGGISADPNYPEPPAILKDACCNTRPVMSYVVLIRPILE